MYAFADRAEPHLVTTCSPRLAVGRREMHELVHEADVHRRNNDTKEAVNTDGSGDYGQWPHTHGAG